MALTPAQRRFRPGPSPAPTEGLSKGGASPYKLGRAFEVSVRGQLERRGFWVMRSYASKTKVDLVAVGKDRPVLFIQCKRRGDIGSAEWNALLEIAETHGGWAVVALRPAERKTAYFKLDAARVPRRQGRPWTPIDPRDCSALPLALAV
jgi:Holliday junction resolvase